MKKYEKKRESTEEMEVDEQPVVSRASTGSFEPIISKETVKLTQDSDRAKTER